MSDDDQICESCHAAIERGQQAHHTADGCWLCIRCAPTYGDLLDEVKEHEALGDADDDAELTVSIREYIERHLGAGGSLTDKATRKVL